MTTASNPSVPCDVFKLGYEPQNHYDVATAECGLKSVADTWGDAFPHRPAWRKKRLRAAK